MTIEQLRPLARMTALGFLLAAFATASPAQETTEETTAESAEGVAETPGPAATLDVSVDDVLAIVGTREVTLGELIALRRDLPPQYQQLPDEVLSRALLDQLIEQTLLAEAARAEGLGERTDIALALANQERAILAEAFLRVQLEKDITEEALRAAYDAQYADAEPVQEVRASHILVETREQADEIRAELDNGADFAELAQKHGTDGTAPRGGDLGFFTFEDMVPAFAEAAFALEVGELGGPVETPFGWHLILVAETRDLPVPSFDEVAPEIIERLQRETTTRAIEELRAQTEVRMSEPPVPASAIRSDALLAPAE